MYEYVSSIYSKSSIYCRQLLLSLIILCIIGSCIRIVPQAHAVIVERLGGYLTTWSVGVHIKMPFVDHVARNVILKEQVVDFDPQPVIIKR